MSEGTLLDPSALDAAALADAPDEHAENETSAAPDEQAENEMSTETPFAPFIRRTSARLASKAARAVTAAAAEVSAVRRSQPTPRAAPRLTRASLRPMETPAARPVVKPAKSIDSSAAVSWLLPRFSNGGLGLVKWGRGLSPRPSPQLLPWPGWPHAPDPLGKVPFALLDGTSGSWIQCDGCGLWLQVNNEVVTAYRKPQNMSFLCRYLTGKACRGDFRRRGEAAAEPRLPVPPPLAHQPPPAKRRREDAEERRPEDGAGAGPLNPKKLVIKLRRPSAPAGASPRQQPRAAAGPCAGPGAGAAAGAATSGSQAAACEALPRGSEGAPTPGQR